MGIIKGDQGEVVVGWDWNWEFVIKIFYFLCFFGIFLDYFKWDL